MSEIGTTGRVSFVATAGLAARARELEAAGGEDGKKAAAAMVARLNRSDELLETVGESLLLVMPLIREARNLPPGSPVQVVRDLLPPEPGPDAKGASVLAAFAETLENLRLEQGGDREPDPDPATLALEDIGRIVDARDRLIAEYRLLATEMYRQCHAEGEYTKRLRLDEHSMLIDIVNRAVDDATPPEPVPVPPPLAGNGTDGRDSILPAAEELPSPTAAIQPPPAWTAPAIAPEPVPLPPSGPVPPPTTGDGPERIPDGLRTEDASPSGGVMPPEDTNTVSVEAIPAEGARIHRPEPAGSQDGKRADVVFVVDASGSMRTCFDRLKEHLQAFTGPFANAGFESLRLGLLAYSANIDRIRKVCVYRQMVLGGGGATAMKALYGPGAPREDIFFTLSGNGRVDVELFSRRLGAIRCKGDEDTPFALDCAADFPFGPLDTTRRVIVLFSDEKIEDGVLKEASLGEDNALLDRVMQKLVARHISLYAFVPESPAAATMGEYSRVFLSHVPEFDPESEGTWDRLDFARVLGGMGKDISSSLNSGTETAYDRAVYGQDRWEDDRWE